MNDERIEAIADAHIAKLREVGHKSGLVIVSDAEMACAAAIRAALTEHAETHAIELRAYEATVANLNERIRQMGADSLMADCMTQTRIDLIEAGVISETVPPMMLSDAVVARIRQLEAALPEIKKLLLQEREWRLESSECGGDEVMDSLDMLSADFDKIIAAVQQQKEGS